MIVLIGFYSLSLTSTNQLVVKRFSSTISKTRLISESLAHFKFGFVLLRIAQLQPPINNWIYLDSFVAKLPYNVELRVTGHLQLYQSPKLSVYTVSPRNLPGGHLSRGRSLTSILQEAPSFDQAKYTSWNYTDTYLSIFAVMFGSDYYSCKQGRLGGRIDPII
ncbi:UNKNOWN [Stylonychia lemnae]|uniref:Uncharacterized protein n=1 Tax=Stylonychia lemnae TaxID=5949 RepID=A0A077ZXZ9_STYLE|nr:UNKNOWN [Stylonychia lemnae]|eukprot:CDW74760.1 UNKNOWN [Stylonychia lemnae]